VQISSIEALSSQLEELQRENALLRSMVPATDRKKAIALFYESQTSNVKPFDPLKIKKFLREAVRRTPLETPEDLEVIIREGLCSAHRFLKAEYLNV
jgi:hypothetical protein